MVCDQLPIFFWCLVTVPPTHAAPGSGSRWSLLWLLLLMEVPLPMHGATSPTQAASPLPHVHSPPHSPTECAPFVIRFTSGREHFLGTSSG